MAKNQPKKQGAKTDGSKAPEKASTWRDFSVAQLADRLCTRLVSAKQARNPERRDAHLREARSCLTMLRKHLDAMG